MFIRLLKTAYSDAGAAQENTQRLEKLLGLKGTQLSSASMRKELILHDAEKLKEEFGLSDRECDAIARHMFPLAPIPRSRIAWIVTLADKAVASREVTLAAGDYIALAYHRVFA